MKHLTTIGLTLSKPGHQSGDCLADLYFLGEVSKNVEQMPFSPTEKSPKIHLSTNIYQTQIKRQLQKNFNEYYKQEKSPETSGSLGVMQDRLHIGGDT